MSEPTRTLPRVLIVDDSRMVRAIIIKHIRGRFDVREEVNGEAGWQALLVDPSIQVVITDQSMPKLDGFGLIERVRSSKIARIREMPLIMISGDEDEEARRHAKSLGATDFITKGIGTAELLSRLDVLVKLSRTSQELESARAQTVTDGESGLVSRAFLLRQGEQAMARSHRHGDEITAVVIGFDDLEATRSRYGEGVGEQILQHFAQMLSASIRREDSLGRWTAERFAILSQNTTLRASNSFAVRLCDSVEAATIQYQTHALRLTVSIGIANSHVDSVETAEAMFSLAEQRMQKAAAGGGNRVVGAGDMPVARRRLPTEEGQSVDQALLALDNGDLDAVRPHLANLARRLLPLLRLLDAGQGHGLLQPDELERRLDALPSPADEPN